MLIKKYLLLFLFLIPVNFSFTQEINITAFDFDKEKAALFSLSGEKLIFMDSISHFGNNFTFKLTHSGIYRVAFDNNNFINFIYDNSDVNIETNAGNCSGQTRFINSEENDLAIEFIRFNKEYKEKSEILRFVISSYNENDEYLEVTKNKLNEVQNNYLNFVNVASQTDPQSFIARYIKSSQLPIIKYDISKEDYLPFLKSYGLSNLNFGDEELIYSDAFTNKTIEYLTYYRNPQLPLELLEKEFTIAIDSILTKARVNKVIYKHILEYMLDGFKKFGFDNVLNYLVENYVINEDICLDEKLSVTLERRIQQAKNFKPGSKVPDIIFYDSLSLSDINIEKTLVIFYSSTCPHCQTILPQIYDIYKKQNDKIFEVLAISLDTIKNDWINYINKNNFKWLNVSYFEGWDSKAAIDYQIYATPTMFLLDKNKILIKIISGIEELNSYL